MDERNEEHINHPQPVSGNGRGRPPYEFYHKGINQEAIIAFLQNRAGGEVVAIVTILVLYLVTSLFIENKGKCFDGKTLVAYLVVSSMIFIIGLVATIRATKSKNVEDTQKNRRKTNKSEASNRCSQQNGSSPRRNGRT